MVQELTSVFAKKGLYEAVDLHFYPFGNAYYPTTKCPGPSPSTGIHCWAPECFSTTPDAGCFKGVPNCQHGPDECKANSIEACTVKLYPNATQFWPFVACFEGQHDSDISKAPGCAKSAGLDWSKIDACYTSPTERAAVDTAAAKATLKHNCAGPDNPGGCRSLFGTPNVYVNDKMVQQDLLTAICNAVTGTKPAGCP
eukprot:TRINITY_DN874_c0_g1_i2.p2 TRINITY_DN874_c0_g1~~TRINITY_DN874_c0_g1_i2.p2  ORF type:complete len:198 (+),score=45.76 TRINITY_DN874_c0_g1_i2:183-776(+)